MGGQPGGTKGAKEDEDPYDMAGLIGALPAKPDEAEDGEEEDDEDEVDVGAGGEADVVDGDDEEPPEANVALRCAMFDSTAGLFFRYRSPHALQRVPLPLGPMRHSGVVAVPQLWHVRPAARERVLFFWGSAPVT